jgi:hypothetical protein
MSCETGIRSAVLLAVFCIGGAGRAPATGECETAVAIKDCPDAVQRTIRALAAGGRIVEIEKECQGRGCFVYEAEVVKPNGIRLEVEVARCGKLLEVEVED